MKAKLTLFFVLLALGSFAQSSGMLALRDRFKGAQDVHHFRLSGPLARMAFKFIDDEQVEKVVQEIKSVELITIPREHFKSYGVTVHGYRHFLRENHFEELMEVRENNEVVSVYLAPDSKSKHERYLIIVDDETEVVVIELRGHLDPTQLASAKITTTQL